MLQWDKSHPLGGDLYVSYGPRKHNADVIIEAEPEDAEFWGVYLGKPGHWQWVEDYATQEDAEAHAMWLMRGD